MIAAIDYAALPHLNAALNATCSVLLVAGWITARRKSLSAHKALMVAALVVSTLFMASYLTYHYGIGGARRFTGTGWVRPVYFAILLSHTVLAAAVPFLALVTAWRGFRGRLAGHVALARWTMPIWIYVSVTGVLIYGMLYVLYPGGSAAQMTP